MSRLLQQLRTPTIREPPQPTITQLDHSFCTVMFTITI
uniref:Uncharacterized protein n=1 Tax=Arundo donax TaxID=35708 RepID=A0A0A9GQG0_ARUDO